MTKPEIYVSIDIECDGPAPGLNSMLALGAVAYSLEGDRNQIVGGTTWYATLEPLSAAREHPDTMAWWKTQPDAWEEVNRNRQPAWTAIPEFADWVEALPGRPVAVAWPAAFDFAWVNYYCHRFAGRNPLGFSCLDIRSFANGLARHDRYFGLPHETTQAMTGEIETRGLKAHNALDDAIGQGMLFIKLLAHARAVGAVTS